MNEIWLYTIISILLVSLMALAGIIFLVVKYHLFKKIQTLLISFAIGTLLGGAFLHLIPESLEHDHDHVSPILIIASIVAFFVLEKYLHILRHHHPGSSKIKSFGPMNLLADGMHNLLDGILIAAAYSIDIHTGVIATAAVLAHELPQELGDFAVLIQAGYSRKKALLYNFISALSAFAGGFMVLLFPDSTKELPHYILPLAAGGFIYIALAELVPELNNKQTVSSSFFQIVAVLFGILIMYLLLDIRFLHH